MQQLFDKRDLSPFGAVIDLDLSENIPERTIDELRSLYDHYHLIVFRNQRLTYDAQQRVSGWFGPVMAESTASYISTDPEVGGLGNSELPFHSDLMCSRHPMLGLSLHAVDVIDEATSTIFVDAIQAAGSLPHSLRARLESLHAMHLWPTIFSERPRSGLVPADWPGTVHPVLLSHPRSGAPILCLNANHTDRIVELEPDESETLIDTLFGYLYDEANRYEHRWRKGDFLVWDNLALQHGRRSIPAGTVRTLQKVCLGTHVMMDLMPPEVIAAYSLQERKLGAN